jgi:hypothetical protein
MGGPVYQSRAAHRPGGAGAPPVGPEHARSPDFQDGKGGANAQSDMRGTCASAVSAAVPGRGSAASVHGVVGVTRRPD